MKISPAMTVCVLFMVLTISCIGQSANDAPPPAAAATEIREKIAADYITNMVKGDYEASRKDFAKNMDDAFPVEKQKERWVSITSSIGAFQKVEYTKEEKVNGNYLIRKRCQFTDQNISVILTFNEENQVIAVQYKL